MTAIEIIKDIVASSDANDGGSLMNAIEAAREWLLEQEPPFEPDTRIVWEDS